jgi:acyl carrier protein
VNREQLEEEIKSLIIDALELEDMSPNDISSMKPLFKDGLGLDSIDSLEIIIALKKKYNLEIKQQDENRKYLHSVSSIADFLLEAEKQNVR